MIASYCSLTDACNRLISECNSIGDSAKKIRCTEYLNEYSNRKKVTLEKADKDFFMMYFLKWLPYKVCLEDKRTAELFYTAAEEYVKLNDMLTGSGTTGILEEIDEVALEQSQRLIRLKIEIVSYINSFVISKIPCVIDFQKYKNKKVTFESEAERDFGKFQVESFFSNNSVVLRKLCNESYFVRLFFNYNIVELIEEKDILDISIVKQENKWVLDDINGCYHPLEIEECNLRMN